MFTLVTTSLVVNYRSATKGVVLNTLAYRITSEVRRAQTYALGNINNSGVGLLVPYGVYFNTATPRDVVLFADVNKSRKYDAGDVLIETLGLNAGNSVSGLCVNMKKLPANCTVTSLSVTFLRPYPEPTISPNIAVGAPYGDADIKISTDSGLEKTIVVWATGQLAIE
jgi:hypothetical protein